MSHAINQTTPSAPVTTNAPRHVTSITSVGTAMGTTMLPILAPELKIPVASARSRRGNHSATVLMQAGKLAASPRPRRNMAIANVTTENAAPGSMAATLQMAMAIAKALRVPSLSVNPPATIMPMA